MTPSDNGQRARYVVGFSFLLLLAALPFVLAVPEGPGFTILSNSSRSGAAGEVINATFNGTQAGGYIYNVFLNATSQTTRWKGFVGNVSGRLVLGDASGSLLFTWTLNSSFSGEVYATRFASSVDFTNINCSNSTHLATEDTELVLTAQDNVTSTFTSQTHSAFAVGTIDIIANQCFAINTYVNSSSQATSFDEVLLQDYTNNVTIYTTITENGIDGYDGATYDFQMIVPENGSVGFNGNTPYYFYVELV